jgi:hypothetical protein
MQMNQSSTTATAPTTAEIKSELRGLGVRGLVAYFNILRTPCLGGRASDPKSAAHLPIVIELLNEAKLNKVASTAMRLNRRLIAA